MPELPDIVVSVERLEARLAGEVLRGVRLAIVLSKADLADDLAAWRAEVEPVALGVPVHAVSALTGSGLAEIPRYFEGNRTVVLFGSSGAGKSALASALAGREVERALEIRPKDARGRSAERRRWRAIERSVRALRKRR